MPAHDFHLKPSRCYVGCVSLLWLASLGILASVSLPLWIRLVLMLVVASYGGWILWRFALLRSRNAIVRIRCLDNGQWQLGTRAGDRIGKLRGDSVVTPILCILRFSVAGKRWPESCVVMRDSMGHDEYKALCRTILLPVRHRDVAG